MTLVGYTMRLLATQALGTTMSTSLTRASTCGAFRSPPRYQSIVGCSEPPLPGAAHTGGGHASGAGESDSVTRLMAVSTIQASISSYDHS